MRRFLVGVLATVGGLALLVAVVALMIGLVSWAGKGSVPSKTILEADLEQAFVEYVPDDPVAKAMLGKAPVVRDLVEALERAADDKRVVGFIAKVGGTGPGFAQAQEVRDAVLAFRAKGKRAVAWAETFGEFGPGNVGYYLATAFDEIYLQPSGDIGLTGLMAESPFLEGALDKLGVVPRMDHRYEYKNAMNMFTETKFTDGPPRGDRRSSSARSSTRWSPASPKGAEAPRARGAGAVRPRAVPRAGGEGREARRLALLPGRGVRRGEDSGREGTRSSSTSTCTSLARAGRTRRGTTVALIYGVGGVQTRRERLQPGVRGRQSMGSDTVTAAFRAAIEDKDVKAILFRVDSPGGSYVASDSIWRETVRAKEAGKPVIVSMGDVAGSGGYFVAMAADKIVAQPGTITGSIGVLGGKMVTRGFCEKLGLTWDEVHTSANGTMWSGLARLHRRRSGRALPGAGSIGSTTTSPARSRRGGSSRRRRCSRSRRGRIWTGEDAKRARPGGRARRVPRGAQAGPAGGRPPGGREAEAQGVPEAEVHAGPPPRQGARQQRSAGRHGAPHAGGAGVGALGAGVTGDGASRGSRSARRCPKWRVLDRVSGLRFARPRVPVRGPDPARENRRNVEPSGRRMALPGRPPVPDSGPRRGGKPPTTSAWIGPRRRRAGCAEHSVPPCHFLCGPATGRSGIAGAARRRPRDRRAQAASISAGGAPSSIMPRRSARPSRRSIARRSFSNSYGSRRQSNASGARRRASLRRIR